MKAFKTMAHIHSLNGEIKEVTVLKQDDMFGHPIPNAFIVDYNEKNALQFTMFLQEVITLMINTVL